MVRARPPAGAKLVGSTSQGRSVGGSLASKEVVLKGLVEMCAVYIFPLILYHLSVLPLPRDHRVALQQSLSKFPWKGRSPLVRRQVCCQRLRDGGLGIPDLESHWLTERLAYLGRSLTTDAVWGLMVRDGFSRLRSNPEAEGRRRPRDDALFTR